MNEISSEHETPPQPVALTPEKESIRVAQEEFVDDTAGPSKDRSEYARESESSSGGENDQP